MNRSTNLWRVLLLAGLTALAACGAPSRNASQPLTPGAAACSVASLTNPALTGSGLGGTGAPAVRGPDPGGIGGTGQVATGSGLGGTGAPMVASQGTGSGLGGTGSPVASGERGLGGTGSPVAGGESGLGGTGIVGVVTGFASICVNGVEVEYPPSMPVERDGALAPVSELAVGQVVALQATGQGDRLRASRIAVIDAAVGPITALEAQAGRFEVMGQPAVALEREDLQGLRVGDWVRVSGQRVSSGDIRATRVQRAAPEAAFATGPYGASGTLGLRVGATPMVVSALPADLAEGQEIGVRGEWVDGRLRARELLVQPTRVAVGSAREVLLQGYVHALQGRELRLGYQSLTLGEQLRVDGGDLRSLRVDQAVQVRGRVDANNRVTVERIELRTEGRRGQPARAASPAASASETSSGSTATGTVSSGSSGSGASDNAGRPLVSDDGGRGRGRGGNSGSGSSNSGSGSSNSGSGSDSGGRGRGRGGDSGSSGSGSSGSGSSGSGSSGSGSSGSGSSGSGSSGSGSSGSGSSGSGSSGSGSSGSGSSGGGDSGGDSSGRGRGRNRGSS